MNRRTRFSSTEDGITTTEESDRNEASNTGDENRSVLPPSASEEPSRPLTRRARAKLEKDLKEKRENTQRTSEESTNDARSGETVSVANGVEAVSGVEEKSESVEYGRGKRARSVSHERFLGEEEHSSPSRPRRPWRRRSESVEEKEADDAEPKNEGNSRDLKRRVISAVGLFADDDDEETSKRVDTTVSRAESGPRIIWQSGSTDSVVPPFEKTIEVPATKVILAGEADDNVSNGMCVAGKGRDGLAYGNIR